jgi:hypothetical protein
MAMRNLQHGPVEGRDVELVAAEHARLQRAIKAGVEERLAQFLRIEAAFVVFRLLLAQQRLQRCRARDQFRRREIGFRHRQNSAHRSPFSETCRHLRFPMRRLCSPHAA